MAFQIPSGSKEAYKSSFFPQTIRDWNDIKNNYKRFRAHVQKSIRDAYWKHITNIFSFENDNPDPDCPRKNEKAKKFWSFVKSLKKDASGINTHRENGILKTDTLDKANICNRQFQSSLANQMMKSPPKAQVLSPLWVKLQLTPKGSLNC